MNNRLAVSAVAVMVVAAAAIFWITTMQQQPEPEVAAHPALPPSAYLHGEDIFITAEELHQRIGSADLVILDGNLPKVYNGGHIPGAVNIGFKGLSRAEGKPGDPLWGTILEKEELTKKLESFGVTNDTLIVGYSDTFKGPGAGGRAVWQLRMAGLKNVKLLYGGLEAWRQHGYQLSQQAPDLTPSSGLVLSDYDESERATLEYVQANLKKIPIIDVRSLKEVTGEDASRGEPRKGRIAGAKWLEWTMLLNSDATPKPPEEIKRLLAEVGVGVEDEVILY